MRKLDTVILNTSYVSPTISFQGDDFFYWPAAAVSAVKSAVSSVARTDAVRSVAKAAAKEVAREAVRSAVGQFASGMM